MTPFLLKSLVVLGTLFLTAWGGHQLTYRFLTLTGLFPPNHDEKQQRISMWIGISERLVVSVLTMFGAIVVTVFVFATKAAVMSTRLDGVTKEEKRQTTEFIFIGTLVSYLFGMLFGLAGQASLDAISKAYSTPQPILVKVISPVEVNGAVESASATPGADASSQQVAPSAAQPAALPAAPVAPETTPSPAAVGASKPVPPKKNGHSK